MSHTHPVVVLRSNLILDELHPLKHLGHLLHPRNILLRPVIQVSAKHYHDVITELGALLKYRLQKAPLLATIRNHDRHRHL
jgi:hypothetical protein